MMRRNTSKRTRSVQFFKFELRLSKGNHVKQSIELIMAKESNLNNSPILSRPPRLQFLIRHSSGKERKVKQRMTSSLLIRSPPLCLSVCLSLFLCACRYFTTRTRKQSTDLRVFFYGCNLRVLAQACRFLCDAENEKK